MLTRNSHSAYRFQTEFFGQMENLLKKVQELKHDKLDPEVQEKLDQAQALLGELYISAEKKMKKVVSDYSFLSRDHVFFDGDHEHHSGAV